ncbi:MULTISPECIES: hypothetical protein [Lactococcus]|uniref:hypothetical protein n=1 Tax=Lactococcus TaxID=1357 RepID=UPI0020404C25|nr:MULTISPECIES: hypothetical protein [Lactococcus]
MKEFGLHNNLLKFPNVPNKIDEITWELSYFEKCAIMDDGETARRNKGEKNSSLCP